MPRPLPKQELESIEEAVRRHSGSMTAREIAATLPAAPPLRTLQYRLKHLVEARRLVKEGEGRWATYRMPTVGEARGDARVRVRAGAISMALSVGGSKIRRYLRQPAAARKPVGYNREFLRVLPA